MTLAERIAKNITGYTRAELATAVDDAHSHLHGWTAAMQNDDAESAAAHVEQAHEALHGAGAGFPRVGCATRDPEAQAAVAAWYKGLERDLPCGHTLADIIYSGVVSECGACLAERQERRVRMPRRPTAAERVRIAESERDAARENERAQDASYWRSYSGCATPGELRLQLHQIAEALGCVGSEGLEAAARRVAGERDAARAISRGAEERIAAANAETLRISADAHQLADRAKVLARAAGDVLDLRDHAEAGTSLWDAIGKLEVAGIVGGTDIVAAMRAAKRAVEAENNALRARVAELEANKGEEKTAAVPCVFDASLFPDGYDERTVAAEARTEESSEPQ